MLDARLVALEATLGAVSTPQPLLKMVSAAVQRLGELHDRTLAEFFEKCTDFS